MNPELREDWAKSKDIERSDRRSGNRKSLL